MLDTNVLSELVKARPEKRVIEWIATIPDEALYVNVLALGELRHGVERLPAGARRERLRLWLENDLTDWFGPRVIAISAEVAAQWGRITASASRTLAVIDALTAATALAHNLRVVTRNVRDFEGTGVEIINPWNVTVDR